MKLGDDKGGSTSSLVAFSNELKGFVFDSSVMMMYSRRKVVAANGVRKGYWSWHCGEWHEWIGRTRIKCGARVSGSPHPLRRPIRGNENAMAGMKHFQLPMVFFWLACVSAVVGTQRLGARWNKRNASHRR